MVRRVSFAAIAIPLVVAIVWFGGWPLAILLATAAVLGADELFGLAAHGGASPLREIGLIAAAAIPVALQLARVSAQWHQWLWTQWIYAGIVLMLALMFWTVVARTPAQRPLASVAVTLLAVIYTSALPATLFMIRHAQWGDRAWAGAALVFFPLIVTWVCDSAAMLGGRMIGGAKLAPAISPGKTRAGGIAGVLGGAVIGAAYAAVIFPRASIAIDIAPAALIALTLSVIGQVGDLAESLFKREAGVKDSSALIPGHGGVLDRLDSLYVVLPATAVAYHLLGVM